MPRFRYTALDSNRKKTKGTLSAESAFFARKQLRARMFHPIDIKEISASEGGGSLPFLGKRVNKGEVVDFTKELATLLNSGIKLTEALAVLNEQISDQRFRNALNDIRERVVTGESFADAIADYGDYFDVIYISMVRVGEMTGSFGPALSSIADFMEKRKNAEAKMITAMIYPVILSFFGFAVMIFFTTYVIPKIGVQITKTGQELPAVTRFVLGLSHILTSWRWVLGILAGITVFLIIMRKLIKTKRGTYIKDKLLISLPIFGKLLKQRIVARFASTFSVLLSSGLPMAESMRVVSEVTGNVVMSEAVKEARERILTGSDIASPLRDSGVINPTIAHMIAVGEKSGELEKMLKNISDNLEQSSDIMIDRMSAAIEPVIIILIAACVAVLALAMILPIVQFSTGQM
jgi:type II secretory pathway component PulF